MMNGSQQEKTENDKNIFDKLTIPTVGYLPDTYKVDLDQDDDSPDVVGLMPHMDAMAMAAESTPVSIAKQHGTICIQPTSTYDVHPYQVCSTQQHQMPISGTTTDVYPNVYPNVTLVAVPSHLTPISVANVPTVEIPDVGQSVEQHIPSPDNYNAAVPSYLTGDFPHQSVTCSVNEFLKAGRRKGAADIKEPPPDDDRTEVSGKLKKLEVRTLFVDFDKRKEDLKSLQQMYASMNVRQLDSIYMKVGCDKERAIEALDEKLKEDEYKRLQALEDWKKNFDKKKIIKRVGGRSVVPPVIKRAKLEDSADDGSLVEESSPESTKNIVTPPESIMFPNQRIPSDVRVYKKFFRRVEPSDAGSRINAFMERNVVEYAAADSEEKARPVRIRNHVRHDDLPCIPKPSIQASIQAIEESSQSLSAVKKEDVNSSVQGNVSTDTVNSDSNKQSLTSVELPVSHDKSFEESKSVSMLGLDDDDDDGDNVDIDSSGYCGQNDEADDDRLSTTSSNTRASNSSGGGASGTNKFFRNKASTAAALHKRAYVSRELSQAWTAGNKRPLPNSVLEMGSNVIPVSNTTPVSGARGRARPRVWTAASDATPVIHGKGRGNFIPTYSPSTPSSLKIPLDSPSSPQGYSTPGQVRQSGGSDQTGDRMTVLDFFNNGGIEDLAGIPSCSRKKAAMIIGMRPFHSMKDLTTRLDRHRPLSSVLIGSCKELLQMRASVNRLLAKCQKISNTIMPRVSSLISQVQIDPSETKDAKWELPSLNKEMTLKPYQVIGVQWLKMLHSLNLNGILADEMGLGKTVETIAFLASLMETGDKGPHLVIVPSTALENWCREFDIWCPSLRVLLYYGSFEERKAMRKEVYERGKNEFNVILTTYSIATNSIEDRTMMKRLDLHYGVFDEAHMLKNMTSQRYRYLMTFKIQRRLLLTGTPLQNNLLELMSLLSFVMPNLFGQRETSEVLKKLFQTCTRVRDEAAKPESNNGTEVQAHSYEKERILQAKSLLRPFMLRRLKSHVLSQLPPKLDVVERVALPPVQRLHYVDMITEMRDQLRREEPGGDPTTVGMLLQLRKAANHTLLHRRRFTNEILREMARTLKRKEPSHKKAKEHLIYEDLCALNDFEIHKICELYKDYIGSYALPTEDIISSSGKLMYLDAALPTMLSSGDRVLLFSQFVLVLDVIEEFLRLRGYRFVRMDGTTRVVDRQDLIDKFQTDPDVFIFLLSTRCGGLGINLTAANVVILHDIDYNPHNDRQAEDRCHRVGQARDVRVIRLLAANTVEEGMYRLACDKLRLEEDITGDFSMPTAFVKTEPEDEEEEENENEEQVGGTSQKHNLASLSKAVEARQDTGTELSGNELKEVKQLLHEALYPQAEKEIKGDTELKPQNLNQHSNPDTSRNPADIDVSISSVDVSVRNNSIVHNDGNTSVNSEMSKSATTISKSELHEVVAKSDDTTTKCSINSSEVITSKPSEKNIFDKMECHMSEAPNSVQVTAQTKTVAPSLTEGGQETCDKTTGSDFKSPDEDPCNGNRTNLHEVEEAEDLDSSVQDKRQHSVETDALPSQTVPSEKKELNTSEANDAENVIQPSAGVDISDAGNEAHPSSTDSDAVHLSEKSITDKCTGEAHGDSEIKDLHPTQNKDASQSHCEHSEREECVLETMADEICSVQSNEKGSNPSEISEDTRPLIISEQRSSTDSEEIDVVGET